MRWLKENTGSLLLSILVSLAIWLVAVRQEDPIEERQYPTDLPVTFVNMSPGMVTSGDFEREVTVFFRAPRSTLNNLTPEVITVEADLGGLSPGTHTVPLKVQLTGVRALNAETDPPDITLTLEDQRERSVPVQVTVEGEAAVGYAAGNPVVEPDTVTVAGPVSVVDSVSEVSVSADVTDARENVQAEQRVNVLDSEGEPVDGLQVEPEQVAVSVPVEHLPDFKEVAVIVSHEGTAPAFGFYVKNIEVSPVTVTVQGPADVINELPGFVRTNLVDLTATQESFSREVGLELPEDVRAVDTQEVTVSVEIDAFQGSVAIRRPVEIVELGEGLEATTSPDSVDMILSGPLAVLEQLSQAEIRVVLDLSDLTPGTYQVMPEVESLPEGVVSESLLPTTIEVQIERASSTPDTNG